MTKFIIVNIPQHVKYDLPLIPDAVSLATWLGIRHNVLWHYVVNKAKAYRVFKIPKRKKGQYRVIEDPDAKLKWIQRQILHVLLEKIPLGEHVAAFVPGRSCADAAAKHTKKAVVIYIDIKDFFPSIRRSMIRQYFHQHIGYSHQVSSLLADLMTNCNRRLPQGAPTSGAISNIIADWLFDKKIIDMLAQKDHAWTYSRYADDLIFSHETRQPKEAITEIIQNTISILKNAGFRTNYEKIKVRGRGCQQKVLGCVVNDKVNTVRKNYLQIRAILNNIIVNGVKAEEEKFKKRVKKPVDFMCWLRGKLNYIKQVNKEKYGKLLSLWEEIHAGGKP